MSHIMAIQQASSKSARISSTDREDQERHHMSTKCLCQMSIGVSTSKMIYKRVRNMRDTLNKPSWRSMANREGDHKGPHSSPLLSRPYKDTEELHQRYRRYTRTRIT